jgi:hypothetical protein
MATFVVQSGNRLAEEIVMDHRTASLRPASAVATAAVSTTAAVSAEAAMAAEPVAHVTRGRSDM